MWLALLSALLHAEPVHADEAADSIEQAVQTHLEKNEYEAAEAALRKLLAIETPTPLRPGREIEIRQQLIGCLFVRGAFLEIRTHTRRILELQRASAQDASVAGGLLDLANIALELDDPAGALRELDELRALLARPEARIPAAMRNALSVEALVLSSVAARRQRAMATALGLAEDALEAVEELDASLKASALRAMGLVYVHLGQFQLAGDYLERALKASSDEGPSRAANLANLGIIAYELEAFEDSERYFDDAEKIYTRLGYAAPLFRLSLQRLAQRAHAEDWKGAGTLLEVLDAAGAPDRRGEAYLNLWGGRFDVRGMDLGRARSRFQKAVAIGREISDRHLEAEGEAGLASVAYAGKDWKRAAAHAGKALARLDGIVAQLSPMAGASARNARRHVYEIAMRTALGGTDPKQAFALLERSRAASLLHRVGGLQALRGSAPEKTREELDLRRLALAEARIAYAQRLQAIGGRLAEARQDREAVRRAQGAYEETLSRLQREVVAQGEWSGQAPLSLDRVRSALGPHDALVLYGLSESIAAALVVTRSGAKIRSLGDPATVRSAVEAFEVRGQDEAEIARTAATLRTHLVDRLALPAGVKRVVLSPDGDIGRVPFSLLDRDRSYTCTPSGSVHTLLQRHAKRTGSNLLGFGDPEYGSGRAARSLAVYAPTRELDPLPGTRAELRAIEREGDTVLFGPRASEQEVRARLGQPKRWATVTFACHGFMNDLHPFQSGLALAPTPGFDGYLSVSEVLALDVRADLVVLSACESGLPTRMRGDGMSGLAGAFLYAGSPRVLASLWKVDDAATKVFMEAFHRHWRPAAGARPLPVAACLRKAQEAVRTASKEWSHPEYWAPWVIWGLPE